MDADATACADATAHVQQCFPDRDVSEPDQCNSDEAEQTLSMSCDQLAAGDKADGLCSPWTWWLCGGGGSDSDDSGSTTGGTDVRVYLEACYDSLCSAVTGGMQCTLLTLEDAAGNELAREYTGTHSSAMFEDVELEEGGEYQIKIWKRDGTLAQKLYQEEGDLGLNGQRDAIGTFTVTAEEPEPELRFAMPLDQREEMGQCVDFNGTVTGSCEGEPMTVDETEWGWFVRLEGMNEAGEYTDWIRPLRRRDVNRFGFLDVLPGQYTVTFVEMDLPEWRQRPNPDYADLADYYATGEEVEIGLELTPDEAGEELFIGDYELDHNDCRF